MKTIGVLVHSLTVEYTTDVLAGICDYFKDKDVKLLVTQSKNPNTDLGKFDYQCWTSANFLFSKQVDGIIVIYGNFAMFMSKDDIATYLELYSSGQPIVSIGGELDIQDSFSVTVDCSEAYNQIIKHLKKKHGCKKIAFMTASLSTSLEAQQRLQAFKNAMKKHKLHFDENSFIKSNFLESNAYDSILERYKTAEDFPFDALVTTNDLMAIGSIKALEELGLKVPQDVKVVGFDDIVKSFFNTPKISTINQKLYNQGKTAAQILYKRVKNSSKKMVKDFVINAEPIYRQSCGCVPMKNTETVFMDEKGRIKYSKADIERSQRNNENYYKFLSNVESIYKISDMLQSTTTLDSFSQTLKSIMESIDAQSIFISFFEKPITLKKQDVFVMPDNMASSIYINREKDVRTLNKDHVYNPMETLLPEGFNDDVPGIYLLQSVFSGENNYGYLVYRMPSDDFAMNCVFQKIIINGIAQAYEYSRTTSENEKLSIENEHLQQDNTDLTIQNKTDELTRLLNRRGFFEFGQRTIDMAVEMNSSGLVFFADLDNLKKINDTYGHKLGDAAIKAIAEVFSCALRSNDIIGRLSGDEFGAIAVGMSHEHDEIFKKKITDLCKEVSKKRNLPFELSCSYGSAEFNKEHSSLKELMSTADERLYNEKRKKHNS